MKTGIIGLFLATAVIAPQAAGAQGQSFYTCPNKLVTLRIPSMPLSEALKEFSHATRCPVSLDTEVVANMKAKDVPTYPVKGRFKPADGLRKMLSSSPLQVRVVKGGYSIYTQY